jgi:uncharacterized protein YbcI
VAKEPEQKDVETDLAAELLRLHRESYGEGAKRAEVFVHDDVVFCVLDDLEMLQVEAFMIENGKGDAVVDIRMRYQSAIESTFRAAVERATGRRVISFASVTKLDPNYAVEVFRLAEPVDQEMPGDPGGAV